MKSCLTVPLSSHDFQDQQNVLKRVYILLFHPIFQGLHKTSSHCLLVAQIISHIPTPSIIMYMRIKNKFERNFIDYTSRPIFIWFNHKGSIWLYMFDPNSICETISSLLTHINILSFFAPLFHFSTNWCCINPLQYTIRVNLLQILQTLMSYTWLNKYWSRVPRHKILTNLPHSNWSNFSKNSSRFSITSSILDSSL